MLSVAYDAPRGTVKGKGRNMTAIVNPANVFFSAEVGSARQSNGALFAGWYVAPGYGLSSNGDGTGRWERGARYSGGRNWAFTDGHAKYTKDVPLKVGATMKTPAKSCSTTKRWASIRSPRPLPRTSPRTDTSACAGLANRGW